MAGRWLPELPSCAAGADRLQNVTSAAAAEAPGPRRRPWLIRASAVAVRVPSAQCVRASISFQSPTNICLIDLLSCRIVGVVQLLPSSYYLARPCFIN